MATVNQIGFFFWQYCSSMFIQVSILIGLLLLIDYLIKNRVRAIIRYALWMLAPIKLMIPPTLNTPYSIGGLLNLSAPLQSGGDAMPEYWHGILFIVWFVGVCIFTALLIQRLLFMKGLIAQSDFADEETLQLLNRCKDEVGIQRNVHLKISPNMVSPVICGFRKPTILLPHDLVANLDREKIRIVLIHELCHLKQHDLGVSLIQTILQVIYFYNPFVWIANARIRHIRELAVDERVLVVLKGEPENYCGTLLDIAEMAFSRPALSLRLIGVVESKHRLTQRVMQISTRPIPTHAKVGIWGMVVVVALGSFLLPMSTSSNNASNTSPQDSWDNTQNSPPGSPPDDW